jgi:hypothetical protein
LHGTQHPVELPRTSPVGLPVPAEFTQVARSYSFVSRTIAVVLLGIFLAVVSVTTTVSLGRYCLTSDTSNTQALPPRYLSGGG